MEKSKKQVMDDNNILVWIMAVSLALAELSLLFLAATVDSW